VYRHFEDVEAFHEEIQRLRSARPAGSTQPRARKRPAARAVDRDQLPLLPEPAANDATEGPGDDK
jgi:hypothetical protein